MDWCFGNARDLPPPFRAEIKAKRESPDLGFLKSLGSRPFPFFARDPDLRLGAKRGWKDLAPPLLPFAAFSADKIRGTTIPNSGIVLGATGF